MARLAPRDMQRTNINLVNVLDPCYRHCCALNTQCAGEIMSVWIQRDMNEQDKYGYTAEIILTMNMQKFKGP